MRVLVIAACGALALFAANHGNKAEYPKTKAQPVTETIHGTTVVDPYRWLEDQNSPDTRAWIEAQIKYTRSVLEPLPSRPWLVSRVGELLRTDRVSPPVARGGKYFYTKRLATQNQAVIYMRKGLQGAEEVLVDPNPMSPDHSTSVSLMGVSPDGSLVTYGIRVGGEDEVRVRFLDTGARKDLDFEMPKARYMGVAMLADRSGVYYSVWKPDGPRVFFHPMASGADKLVFGEKYGPALGIGCDMSADGRWLALLVFYGSSSTKSEVYVKDLRTNGAIVPVATGIDAYFSPEFAGDTAYFRTNWKAPNSRVLAVDLKDPEPDPGKWREVVPEAKSALEAIAAVGGRIACSYLENVSTKIRLYTPEGKLAREVQLPGIGSSQGLSGTWDSPEAFYSFTSFVEPMTVYRYDLEKGVQSLWFRTKLPVDSSSMEVEQVWYASKDKTRIPMFLVHKKGLKPDRNRPVYLTGYGGFNLPERPNFSALAAIWSELDGVFAVPNLRGGGEFGEAWHKAGMLENKQNVFDDFIGAAEYLIEKGWTNPKKLSIRGGSNGGLLVGAAMTQRPDLFGAVVCAVPLLDMVRYHQFKIAKFWVPEYGSSEDPAQFKYIYAYSPYHHVKAGTKYPAVMFVTGDSDTRVDPLHARKMTALMQASTGSDRPVLLHYDTKSGHSGGKPVDQQIQDTADELAFLMWQLNVPAPKPN